MRFACEQCQTKYTIPDERVRGKILKIRCKNCNCQITISEGGVRTARPLEAAGGGDTIIPTKGSLPALGEGGDATMIGGMADFFSGPAAAAPAAAEDWYISIDGATAGPMPLPELAQRVVAEEATPSHEVFVWREGLGEWLPPADVPEVKTAVTQERRVPAPKPRMATKLGLSPIQPPAASLPAVSLSGVGGSLLDENEDATQIGSLSAPIAPPAPAPLENSGLALEPVDFDMVTDLPAPPKPQTKPAPAPAAKPKGPPAFKPPPPIPGPAGGAAGPRGPQPPRSVPPFDVTPPVGSPMVRPVASAPPAPAMASSSPAVPATTSQSFQPPPVSQSFQPPPLTEDPTGALPGAAVVAPPPAAAAPYPGADPMGSSQPPMGMMGGAPADLAAAPIEPGAAAPPTKPSPLILAALAVVVLLGIGTTVWVLMRPSKTTVAKREVVDAGPMPDALPSEADKVAQAEAQAKQQKAKKDELLGITAEQRDALIEKGQKQLSSCFGKLLKKEPKLAGGALSVEVTIGPKGKIDTVEVSAKDKELDGKNAKCFQKAIKRWKFPKHSDKTAYQVKFSLPIEG